MSEIVAAMNVPSDNFIAEMLLKARGEWEEIVGRYVAERSVAPAGARV